MSPTPVDYSDLTYSMAGIRRTNPFDRRRSFAQQLLQQGMDTSPVQHPLQGVSRLAQALAGGFESYRADADEKAATDKYNADLTAAMTEQDPQKRIALLSKASPDLAARFSGQMAVEQAKIDRQKEGLVTGAQQLATGYGVSSAPPGPPSTAGQAIASIESAGQPNGGYGAVGPPATPQGNRAYGKYQVLDTNIGPWTQEVLGKAMSPQEFLASPQAQDAVFQAKWSQYRQQYGSDEAASRAWFAGPGGMNNPGARDVNGMTVRGYAQKFQQAMPPGPQVAQGSTPQVAPGTPPAPSPQGINAPAVVAPPVPDVPRPQPSPELIQKHQQILLSGGYGTGPEAQVKARAAIEAEVERDWGVQRDRAKMGYQQKLHDYNEDRRRETEKNDPKFTEDANKAHAYALRLSKALPAMEEMVNSKEGQPSRLDRAVTNLWGVGNMLAGPRGERFDQLERDIVNAILRRESGATISETEFENAHKQYIPQPGDSPETIQLKMENIRTQLKAFADVSNRTPDIYGMTGGRGTTVPATPVPTPGTNAPAPGTVEDGWLFKGGNPADRRNWERTR